MNYYNEWDKYAAQWLRNLIAAKLIPPGDVDERSIVDVQAKDLEGYIQCHFFAGIGGWSRALQLAGWPEDRPVWTGSCPCQPFSAAGKRKGLDDERHLWPEFLRLISECRPSSIFGEQVASKDGRLWLAGVRTDLEALAYRVGGSDLCAAGIGAPHIRSRLFWMADSGRSGNERWLRSSEASREAFQAQGEAQERERSRVDVGRSSGDDGLADAKLHAPEPRWTSGQSSESTGTEDAGASVESGRRGLSRGMGDSFEPRLEGYARNGKGGG